MKSFAIWAVLSTALTVHAMHVSSEDEARQPTRPKNIEMQNFAHKPPAQSSESSRSEEQEQKPICFGNMDKKKSALYSPMYTLASIDKNDKRKSK